MIDYINNVKENLGNHSFDFYFSSGVSLTCTSGCTYTYASSSTPTVSSVTTNMPNGDNSAYEFTFAGSGKGHF